MTIAYAAMHTAPSPTDQAYLPVITLLLARWKYGDS